MEDKIIVSALQEESSTVHERDVGGEHLFTRRVGLIQLTREGMTRASDLSALRQQFSRRHSIRLPQLLSRDLISVVLAEMERGLWLSNAHGQIGRELLLDHPRALAALRWVVNAPDFLRTVEYITQCDPISVFDGRVYRMEPGTDHYDSWHDDATDNRIVGMSLNLGSLSYSGGVFQLREGSGPILCELPNTVQGDAILFRISPELKHRITPMRGTEPKTAFAGWFRSGTKDLLSQVRQLSVLGSYESG